MAFQQNKVKILPSCLCVFFIRANEVSVLVYGWAVCVCVIYLDEVTLLSGVCQSQQLLSKYLQCLSTDEVIQTLMVYTLYRTHIYRESTCIQTYS